MSAIHYDSEEGFAALKEEWNSLLEKASTNTIFLTWEWQHTWWSVFQAGDLWLTEVREGGELKAIFPCRRRIDGDGLKILELGGDRELADYLDLIMMTGWERPALESFLSCLMDGAAPEWDQVVLDNLRADSAVLTLLPEMATHAGLSVNVQVETVCPIITLPGTWEEYLRSLDKKQRHEIRRKLRRAGAEAEMEWYIVDKADNLDAEMTIFLDLHRKSSAEKQQFMDRKTETFFLALSRNMYEQGWLQLMHLKLDSRHVASIFSFDYGDTLMVYNSGYDPTSHAHLSPGIVLMSLCLQNAMAHQKRTFDLMRGDEEYKYRFGARDTHIYRVTLKRDS